MERFIGHRGKLFVISGPSGAGKGTICKELVKDSNVEISVSATTRNPRAGEEEGKSYYFLDEKSFVDKVKSGGFLEHAQVYGNYYGTPKEPVIEKLRDGKDVILEIDIQGAMKIKENYPNGIFIFILPPSMSELRKRLTGRGSETEESINLRMSKTLSEISYIEKYDYCVVNGELEEAVHRVKSILVAEHSKVSKDVRDLIKIYEEEK